LNDPRMFVRVLDELTVQTSELFRDPGFCAAFRARVVPLLRTYPLLRIWHAGCSSGEEAYTSAIMLREEGLYDRAQIYATDLSARAIEQAQRGVYAGSRRASFERNYRAAGGGGELSSVCSFEAEALVMSAALRRNVLFFQHNLVSDSTFGEMHVIFCRNVFIYFQAELRRCVLQKFAQSLRPGGFLCLGSSEGLTGASLEQFSEFVPEERIYQRLG